MEFEVTTDSSNLRELFTEALEEIIESIKKVKLGFVFDRYRKGSWFMAKLGA